LNKSNLNFFLLGISKGKEKVSLFNDIQSKTSSKPAKVAKLNSIRLQRKEYENQSLKPRMLTPLSDITNGTYLLNQFFLCNQFNFNLTNFT